MIYFIEAMIHPDDSDERYSNLYKIGFTNNPEQRLRRLQLMSPVQLLLQGWREGDRTEEAALHARFARLRSHGEWFRGDEDIIDYIFDYCVSTNNHALLTRYLHDNA